jgi:glycosyltransferase involved in cell wall biosynthesis
MKVAMIARPNLYEAPGGDTVQIKETAIHLKKLGVQADIVINNKVDFKNYDLLHFFNIIDPEDILGYIYQSNQPYVVSTIYVDYKENDSTNRTDIVGKLSKWLPRDTIEYFKTLGKYIFKNEKISTPYFFLKGHKASILYITERAQLILPNSENEYKRFSCDYKINKTYRVIPNGINTDIFKKENIKSSRDIVLCVGRIESQKNQLNVIRALKNSNYKLVFIGSFSKNQEAYYKQCKAEANENTIFIDFIPQNELIAYYQRAKVHVLASWFETTGLSNLEAGSQGCNLVLSNKGDVKDYFEDLVTYCDPNDINSIKTAVDIAWNLNQNTILQTKIFNNFTWDQAANATLQAYKMILK